MIEVNVAAVTAMLTSRAPSFAASPAESPFSWRL
jgi:hypothetical protein